MKKVIKTFWGLIVLVTIIAIIYMVVLFPTHEYSGNMDLNESFDMSDTLKKAIPKNFSIENRKMKTSIDITEDELKSLISREINKKVNVDNVDISIENNELSIFVKQKMWRYFPTELSLIFTSVIKDDKAILLLSSAKLGKINLSKEEVLDKIKDNKVKFFNVRPLDSEIILENQELKHLIAVNEVKLEDHKVSIDIEFKINSLQDFMELMKLATKK